MTKLIDSYCIFIFIYEGIFFSVNAKEQDMEPLKTSVHDMVNAAKARIGKIIANDALNLIADENIVIVDKRDICERHKLG